MADEGTPLGKIVTMAATLGMLAVGVAGLGAMVVLGRPEPPTVEPEKTQDPLVKTQLVKTLQGPLDIKVDGVVVPRREIAVTAEVGGRVVEKADACEAGKYVRKGTPLIAVYARDYELEVLRLEKELKQADVSLEELDVSEKNTRGLITLAQDSLKLQHKEVTRLEQLAERGENYVTESQVDVERRSELAARNALVTLENQLRTLQAQRGRLEAAGELVQANLEKARLNLSRTQITAPIDGMIVKDSVEEDAYVAPGTIVATIEDVVQCNVRCNLRMDELYWIWNQPGGSADPDQAATARDYLLPPTSTKVIYKLGDREYEWDGTLARYDGIGLDETTRTVPCIVVVEEPNKVREEGEEKLRAAQGPRALVRGMYVELIIHAQPRMSLLDVPEKAVRPGNNVWRVRAGKLHTVPVRVVGVMDDRAVIRAKQETPRPGEKDETLRPGDQVVTTPMASVCEGMSVRVQPEKETRP